MQFVEKIYTPDKITGIYLVHPDQHGLRLDHFMKSHLGTLSRNFIQDKIRKAEIYIQGISHDLRPASRVQQGQRVVMLTLKADMNPLHWRGQLLDLDLGPQVLYEDKNYIAALKPPFMVTHPTGKFIFHCATVFFETRTLGPIYSVHRLDRETSGVLILAKNQQSAHLLTSAFENGNVRKAYFLIAHKINPSQQQQQRLPRWAKEPTSAPQFPICAQERIGRLETSDSRILVRTYVNDSPLGKESQTLFVKIEENDHFYLLLAFPRTGRQHQIRVHAAHHGFPLVGDKLYSVPNTLFQRCIDNQLTSEDCDQLQLPRQALHAIGIQIPHPEVTDPTYSKSKKTIIAPLPSDLKEFISESFPHLSLEELQEKIHLQVQSQFV